MLRHSVRDVLQKRMVYQFTKLEAGKLKTGSTCAATRVPQRYTTICRSCQGTRRNTFLPIVRALADPSVVLSSVPFVQSRRRWCTHCSITAENQPMSIRANFPELWSTTPAYHMLELRHNGACGCSRYWAGLFYGQSSSRFTCADCKQHSHSAR